MGRVATLYLRRNDMQPYYYAKAIEADGTIIDLTGASIKATMVNEEEIQLSWTDTTMDETGFTVERCIEGDPVPCLEVSAPPSTGIGSVTFTATHRQPDTDF